MEPEVKENSTQPELTPVIFNEETNVRLGNDPDSATKEAIATAQFLKKMVIDKKEGLMSDNGKRYIEFTEWQTLGNYYKVSVETEVLEYEGKGIHLVVKARGIATHIVTGQRVGSAEAFCERREKGKGKHSLNQIASMAQTRAGSKAMRNALGWVVELAGMCSTPAEEMEGIFDNSGSTVERTQQPAPDKEVRKVPKSSTNGNGKKPKSGSRPKSSTPKPEEPEWDETMPEAEKVKPKEPDNVQEGELTGESYWKQLADENPTLHVVLTEMANRKIEINKKNILETSMDLVPDWFDNETRHDLVEFLKDKKDQ